jgi:type VI protein secretion system component VasK
LFEKIEKIMNISSIGSTTSSYPVTPANTFNQFLTDFQSIGSDIQSGNLTSAQSALTAFQNDLQSSSGQNPLSRLFSNNSTLTNDLASLQTALQSNNPASAQNAFNTLVQDMQTAIQTQKPHHHHHHHHRADDDGDNDDSSTSSSPDSFTNPITGLPNTGNILNAQA